VHILTCDAEEDLRFAEEERLREEEEAAQVEAEAARAAAHAAMPPSAMQHPDASIFTVFDQSMGDTTMLTSRAVTSGAAPAKKKTNAKPKLTAKEKKERSAMIERVIGILPLSYRGNDPVRDPLQYLHGSTRLSDEMPQALRSQMEAVIEGMLDDTTRGYKCMYM
jgi:DASH complex subunit DAM1